MQNYRIVAVDNINDEDFDEGKSEFFQTFYVIANGKYYMFNYDDDNENIVGRELELNANYPLGNWIMGIRDFEETDLEKYSNFKRAIYEYFLN